MSQGIEFEWTLLDGRVVTAHADMYSSGDWSVGLGAGFEEVWVTDKNDTQLEISAEEEERIDAEAMRIMMDQHDDPF